jgi:hypothetical protein
LQANVKVREGSAHEDRDAQFRYLNEQVADHQQAGAPVVSVDTKKKELVGDYKNNGQEWLPQGRPERVQVHDFPDPKVGKAIPYGIYDVAANTGWVSVGQDHDTSAFAVATLRRWWRSVGQIAYPAAERLALRVGRFLSSWCLANDDPKPAASAPADFYLSLAWWMLALAAASCSASMACCTTGSPARAERTAA